MANMSYCRFDNTLGDLEDCVEHLGDYIHSVTESDARLHLVITCVDIINKYANEYIDPKAIVDNFLKSLPDEESEYEE